MDLSTPFLMIRPGFLLVHTLSDVAPVSISFTTGIGSVCGVFLILAILGLVGGGKTETSLMVRQLKMFWSKIPLLVLVTVSGSLVRPPCASLAVAVFNSYLASLIVKFLTALTSSYDFLDSHW